MLLSTLFTSCATIVNSPNQTMSISSYPSEATVTINRCYMGETPMIVSLKRGEDHFVKIELEGYRPYELILTRRISGWLAGNIIFGGVLGIVIDAVTGSMYKLTPEQIDAYLEANCLEAGSEFISVTLKADPDWEKVGELEKVVELKAE